MKLTSQLLKKIIAEELAKFKDAGVVSDVEAEEVDADKIKLLVPKGSFMNEVPAPTKISPKL